MAVLQEIKVPLVSVSDRSLTVIETPFFSGDKVNEGDVVLIFETSKTTYDVEAGVAGYVQYLCVAGEDYEVETVVTIIYDTISEAREVTKIDETGRRAPQKNSAAAVDWSGKTLFSKEALNLINMNGINENVFADSDFVNRNDVTSIS